MLHTLHWFTACQRNQGLKMTNYGLVGFYFFSCKFATYISSFPVEKNTRISVYSLYWCSIGSPYLFSSTTYLFWSMFSTVSFEVHFNFFSATVTFFLLFCVYPFFFLRMGCLQIDTSIFILFVAFGKILRCWDTFVLLKHVLLAYP